jgi:hypothetical protein
LPFGGGIRISLRWEAMTLRAGSGSAAHEREFGADIMGVLTVETRDFKTAKGFLAQAKRAEPRTRFARSEWDRLHAQCQKMLAVTPDAFVLVYSLDRGVRFPFQRVLLRLLPVAIFLMCTTSEFELSSRSIFNRSLEIAGSTSQISKRYSSCCTPTN